MILCLFLILRLVQSQREEELGKIVENLDATEDREASEESHRASDQTKSPDKGHLCILLNFVKGRAVKEDVHHLKVQGDLGS